MSRVRTTARLCGGLLVLGIVAAGHGGEPPGRPAPLAPSDPLPRPVATVVRCSTGLVALTFDDGPQPSVTRPLLDVLADRRVPATFFVVGQRVRSAPALTRRIHKSGFALANHSYRHENLTRLSNSGIRSTLRRTGRAIRDAGARHTGLMRPPYGAIDRRVRGVVGDLGLVPVLWDVDPRDWAATSTAQIVRRTISGLEPGRNVVLLHDGVARSHLTLQAVPRIIRQARERGYCFARLDAQGRPVPPVPRARVSDVTVTERPGGTTAAVRITLSRPTSRRTSVRVRTVALSAAAGSDFRAVDERVFFPVGVTRRVVRVQVRDDLRDEPVQQLQVRLSAARGLRIGDGTALVRIRDDDPPPRVRVLDASIAEPASGTTTVPVLLRLSRVSERPISLVVATAHGTAGQEDYVPVRAELALAPGQVQARVEVTVLADQVEEEAEWFTVTVVDGRHVNLTDASNEVWITPFVGN